jgi:signal transduction histidine kinase
MPEGPGSPSRGHGPGFRPPWWPENEPFPPSGPGGWPGPRRHFLRRILLLIGLFFGASVLANVLAVVVLSEVFGIDVHHRLAPFVAVLGVGLVAAFIAAGRAARRMAGPIGTVMEAADRVASGDYSIRVEERGPREISRLARSFNTMTERLESAESARRDLLADLAHELRTPLSVIQGNAEGMLDGVYPPDRSHLSPVVEETRVMARLLDDLQTLSTADAGVLPLHRRRVDPADLVEEAVAAFRARAEAAGVTIHTDVAPGLPELEVDPVRIGQVLANLLLNAVRYVPAGGSITVAASPATGPDCVELAVADTGAGIPADVLPHVFDRFVKGSPSTGAGLGLAIARSLVKSHGGSISAESKPGKGTRIAFVLPCYGV